MMVELKKDVTGLEFTPALVTLKNNSSLEQMSVPVTNTSNSPVTIQADKVIFSLEPILNVRDGQNIHCQSTTCSTEVDKDKQDLIKKLTAMTKLEGE